MLDRTFLTSPPFGNYRLLSHPAAYRVIGSFTAQPRPGRLGQIARTLRPVPGGWVNSIGLRNPGVASLLSGNIFHRTWNVRPGEIISLAALVSRDWDVFLQHLIFRDGPREMIVELNVSCPNVDEHPDLPPRDLLHRAHESPGLDVIVKLAPVEQSVRAAMQLVDECGVRYLHLSNTLPSPVGGISGRAQREVNLPLVERVASLLSSGRRAEVIAGGGIYEPSHLRAYEAAGATRFSMSTAWFRPWRALRVINAHEEPRPVFAAGDQ